MAALKKEFKFKVRQFDEAKEDAAVSAYCRKRAPKQAEEYVEGRVVGWVVLEAGTLEVLDDVGLAVGALLLKLVGERQADYGHAEGSPAIGIVGERQLVE